MSEALELQQVICPSCRQPVASFNPFDAVVECPYCHNQAFNPLLTARKIAVPKRIAPFRTTQAEFEQLLIDKLCQQDFVPRDIFDHLTSSGIYKVFLPMFRYEGRYEAAWSCMVGGKEGYAHSSSGRGNFDLLLLANENGTIPGPLRESCTWRVYNAADFEDYDPALLRGADGESAYAFAPDVESEDPWAQRGEELVETLATQKVAEHLQHENYGNLHVSCSYDMKGEASVVLVPYWYTIYSYGGRSYYYLMDGQGGQQKMTFPKDKKEEDRYKCLGMPWSVVAVAILPWFLIVPLWMELHRKTGSYKGGCILVLVWLVALIIYKRRASSQQKTFLAAAVGARKVGAVRMKSRLQKAVHSAAHRSAVS